MSWLRESPVAYGGRKSDAVVDLAHNPDEEPRKRNRRQRTEDMKPPTPTYIDLYDSDNPVERPAPRNAPQPGTPRSKRQRVAPPPPLEKVLREVPSHNECRAIFIENGADGEVVSPVHIQHNNFCQLHAASNALNRDVGTPADTIRHAYLALEEDPNDAFNWNALFSPTGGNFDPDFFKKYLKTRDIYVTRNGYVNSRAEFLRETAAAGCTSAILSGNRHAIGARRVEGRWLLLESLNRGRARWLDNDGDWVTMTHGNLQELRALSRYPPAR
jgi:hypothetical protein